VRYKIRAKQKTTKKRKEMKTGLLVVLGLLVMVPLVSASYAAVDVDKIMVQNIFEDDSIEYVLNQIVLGTGVMIRVDYDIVEGDITVDWTKKPVTLRGAMDYICGVENVWGLDGDVIIVAPIDPDSANFQKLCRTTAFPLLYIGSKEALKLMDDYYARLCKADEQRNRIIVNVPPKLREEIKRYLKEVVDSPREKVVLKSSTVFIKKSSLGELGFRGASYEWGDAVPTVDRQFAQILTGLGGVYESEKAGKLWLAIDLLVEKGLAIRKANPVVVGEAGSLIRVKFGEKTWLYTTPPEIGEGYYRPWDIKEIEAPISLEATPWVNGNVIALEDMKVCSSAFGTISGLPGSELVVSEQIVQTRVTVKSGQMIIIGGLSKTTKTNILSLLLPGKRWREEEVEVLMFIQPQLWTPELANRETFLEKILKEESLTKKKEGFIKRHPILTLLIIGGIVAAASSK